jgi:GR25 family glycosyltransferase involved in LPS biosynthesis
MTYESKKQGWSIESIPAVCITLGRRPDRWTRFQDQPGIKGLHVTRFLGVDGKTIDIKTDTRVTTLTKRNIITKTRRAHEELDSIGGVGCALSHIAVWQQMIDKNYPVCLVFEDDAVVPPQFIETANSIIKGSLLENPSEWDLWLLGGKWDDMSHIPGSQMIRIEAFVLFHAYVLTLDMAKKLVQDAYPIHAHIDTWTSIHSYVMGLRIVGSPALRLQQYQRAKTDIQSEEGCAICNVPSDFKKDYAMIPKLDLYVARASELFSIVVVAYMLYQRYKK